jgi:Phasin protein
MMDEKNPFEAIQALMLENLKRMHDVTQSYVDMFEKAMQGTPGANQDAMANFKTYLERQIAANRDFIEKLLHARDFQEAFRIQVDHFQSQLKVVAEDASKFGTQIASTLKPPTAA